MVKKINDLKDRILSEIPISDIIGSRIETVKDTAICPFHNDKKLGSFHFSNSKAMYKCFTCDSAGNGINFVMEFEGISYKKAVCKIAAEFGMITKNEYKKMVKQELEGLKIKEYIPIDRDSLQSDVPQQEDEILDLVYSLMTLGSKGYDESQNPLSETHLAMLIEDRNCSIEQIKKRGYFTFPTDKKKFLNFLEAQLVKRDLDPISTLIGVPGFFFNNKLKKVDMFAPKGMMIPIKNGLDQTIALQIRKDTVKSGGKDSRYSWYSSGFANDIKHKDVYCGGSSPSKEQIVPVDIVIPTIVSKNTVFITEGHFKAMAFSNKYNCISIAVQGVGNYKGVITALDELSLLYPKEMMQKICIGYDSDMYANIHVFNHSIGLGKALKMSNRTDISYLVWDSEKGKGIDDCINRPLFNNSELKLLEFSHYYWKLMKYFDLVEQLEDKDNIEKMKDIFKTNVLH